MMKSIRVPSDKEGVGTNFNKMKNYTNMLELGKSVLNMVEKVIVKSCRVQPPRKVYQKKFEGKTTQWNRQTAYHNGRVRSHRTEHVYSKMV